MQNSQQTLSCGARMDKGSSNKPVNRALDTLVMFVDQIAGRNMKTSLAKRKLWRC